MDDWDRWMEKERERERERERESWENLCCQHDLILIYIYIYKLRDFVTDLKKSQIGRGSSRPREEVVHCENIIADKDTGLKSDSQSLEGTNRTKIKKKTATTSFSSSYI